MPPLACKDDAGGGGDPRAAFRRAPRAAIGGAPRGRTGYAPRWEDDARGPGQRDRVSRGGAPAPRDPGAPDAPGASPATALGASRAAAGPTPHLAARRS